jgi:VWFA-related protein
MFFMGLLLMLLLASPALAQEQEQTPTFRTGTAWVRIDVQAGEGERLLGDLHREDFVVYDEGEPQKILYFGRDSEPLDVVLLLDVSGSMRRYLEQMAANARNALKELHEGDRVAVIEFSRRSHIEEDLTTDRQEVIGGLHEAVRQQGLGGGTRTNAAILSAAAYIEQADAPIDPRSGPRPGRRAMLVVTDNSSMDYQMPDEKAVTALLGADTVLNAIVVGEGGPIRPPRAGQYVNPDFTRSDVFAIAAETGGEAVKATRAGVSFRNMMESIRTRYSIQYAAPETARPGTLRRLRVEFAPATRERHPRAWIRARAAYVVK